MKTEKLNFCMEQNSGWSNSYTPLFTPGNPCAGSHINGKTPKIRVTDTTAAAEKKLLTEMHQSCLLFFTPNPNLVPQKSQRSQEAKMQLFPRHKQRADRA